MVAILTAAGVVNIAYVVTEKRTVPQILAAFIEITVGLSTMMCLLVPFIIQQGITFTVTVYMCMALPLIPMILFVPEPPSFV